MTCAYVPHARQAAARFGIAVAKGDLEEAIEALLDAQYYCGAASAILEWPEGRRWIRSSMRMLLKLDRARRRHGQFTRYREYHDGRALLAVSATLTEEK